MNKIKDFIRKINYKINKNKDISTLDKKKENYVKLKNVYYLYSDQLQISKDEYINDFYSPLASEFILFILQININEKNLYSINSILQNLKIIDYGISNDNISILGIITGKDIQKILFENSDIEEIIIPDEILLYFHSLISSIIPLENRFSDFTCLKIKEEKDDENSADLRIKPDNVRCGYAELTIRKKYSVIYKEYLIKLKNEFTDLYNDIILYNDIHIVLDNLECVIIDTDKLESLFEKYNYTRDDLINQTENMYNVNEAPMSIDELMEKYPDEWE